MCAFLVLLMSTAQATHICGFEEALSLQHGKSAVVGNTESGQTTCAICINSHSPSIAAQCVRVVSLQGSSEAAHIASPIEHSTAKTFALYIRPPPKF
jgi:hypothetical protein